MHECGSGHRNHSLSAATFEAKSIKTSAVGLNTHVMVGGQIRDAPSGISIVPLVSRVRGVQNVHQQAEVGEGAPVSLGVPSPSNRRMRVLWELESLLELGVLGLGEVNPPSPWINVFPVISPFVSDDPVNHLALKGTVLVQKLSRPNLLTVITTGDPYTSLSIRAQ